MSPGPTQAQTYGEVSIGERAQIASSAILGFGNAHPNIFCSNAERVTRIGDDCQIGPWALIYEGARLEDKVIIDARSMVGSKTTIGASSRLYYGAQVHDRIEVGQCCIIAGFVADNCRIGRGCSIFGSLIHRYSNPGVNPWDTTDEIGPTLGANVLVGWGAVLIGPIQIGDGARIAPNAVVRENVAASYNVC